MTHSTITKVFSTFRERGHEEYHGEPVSQLEHAAQTAELAKRGHPNDPDFILDSIADLCDDHVYSEVVATSIPDEEPAAA